MDGNISIAVELNALKLDNRQYCTDSHGPQRINQIFRTLLVFSVMPFTTVRWISIYISHLQVMESTKMSIDPVVAWEEAACNLNCLQCSQCCCIVGNVGSSFWKGRRMNRKKKVIFLALPIKFNHFSKPGAYITYNAFFSTEWHHWQFIRIHTAHREMQKALNYFFSHIWSSTLKDW